jgi:hypothetical protein
MAFYDLHPEPRLFTAPNTSITKKRVMEVAGAGTGRVPYLF